MATVNLGRLKPVFKGAYNSGTAYVIDDIVTYANETYINIQAGTNQQPNTATGYWTKLAAKGGDVTQLTTQGDILYRDGSGVARLGAGTSGQFLKTLGTGANPVWGSVTSKLLGEKTTVYQTRQVLGSTNQNATEVTGLATTYGSPVKNTSYFIVRADITQWVSGNHARGALQFSVDGGSNWSSDWTHTRSGSTLAWGSSATLYNYPHIATIYLINDTNTTSQSSCLLKYAPSTPHSVSDFRVRYMVWVQDGADTVYMNGISNTSNNHSSVLPSSIQVQEYDT